MKVQAAARPDCRFGRGRAAAAPAAASAPPEAVRGASALGTRSWRRWASTSLTASLLLGGAACNAGPPAGGAASDRPAVAHVKAQLAGADERVTLVREPDGSFRFVIHYDDDSTRSLSPREFAALVHTEQSRFRWWNRLLNITSPIGIAWVSLGLLGQLLFAGRMVMQWLVSEHRRRSVVPPLFWWLSLAGATMLLVYFVWRRDIIGVLGQSTGWFVYARNLRLIYRVAGQPTSRS